MSETPQEIVDRVFRENRRYTGDGLPGEPQNAPLPVGDPASGAHNPKKADMREALKAPIAAAAQSASEAAADADRTATNALAVVARAWFKTVADLIADNNSVIGYTGSGADFIVSPGDIIEAQGFRYEVAAGDATDYHIETVGGVRLLVLIDGPSLNATAFGSTGDGVTDDYDAIDLAIAVAVDLDVSLYFPDGTYCHSQTIEWNRANNFRVDGGMSVTFKHTGTGIAHSFRHPHSVGVGDGFKRNSWGWGKRFTVQGNPAGGTTIGVYIDNWHWSYMMVKIRDCETAFSGANTGDPIAAAAVNSVFDVYCSPAGGETFDVQCTYGMYLDLFAACLFVNPTIEGCGHGDVFAIYIANNSNGNTFISGTAESNIYGGVYVGANCNRNNFINMHNEANGYRDWQIDGSGNTFQNIAGVASAAGSACSGNNNTFRDSVLQSMEIAGADNRLDNCEFVTAFTDSGSRTLITRPRGSIGVVGAPTVVGLTLASGVANNNASTRRVAACYKDVSGLVVIEGIITCGTISGHPTVLATLPAGYWPSRELFYVGFNLSTDGAVALTINTAGEIVTRAAIATGNVVSIASPPFRPI